MLVRVYACQNATLLEITCQGSFTIMTFIMGLRWLSLDVVMRVGWSLVE